MLRLSKIKQMYRGLTVFLVFLVAVQAIDTVKELDLNAYLGDWYEVASSPLVRLTFERNGYCQRATYTLRKDGSINVLNQQRKSSVTGVVDSITGKAYTPDASEPGKLKVDFGFGSPGNYWVLALGPIVHGKYQYSVVSEPRKLMMWVLARDPQDYINIYEATVKPLVVDEFGFNHLWNKYQERSHEGCTPYDQE